MTHIEGFVPLASYDDEGRSRQSGHSPAWKMLREAIDAGDIDGFQHGGSKRWLVNKIQADKYLLKRTRVESVEHEECPRSGKTQIECLQNIEETLAAILDLLRASLKDDDRPNWRPDDEDIPE